MEKILAGLYVISTPIGNMNDISKRAIFVLENCDFIVAEDTRVSKRMLNNLGIDKPIQSNHKYNEFAKADSLIEAMKGGKTIVLISDAGTPCVSDPGMVLVNKCYEEGIFYTHISGACSLISAYVLSGIISAGFSFIEFLPTKESEKTSIFQNMKNNPTATIFFESPHRIIKTLNSIRENLGGREVAIVKEISKIYEFIRKDSAENLIQFFDENPDRLKGEFIFVIAPVEAKKSESKTEAEIIEFINDNYSFLVDKLHKKDLSSFIASKSDLNKKEIYNALQNMQ